MSSVAPRRAGATDIDPNGPAPAPEPAPPEPANCPESNCPESNLSAPDRPETRPGRFDLAFYKSYYPDIRAMTEAEAARHWHERGRAEGRAASLDDLLASTLRDIDPLPADFSLAVYKFLNPDLMEVFRHDWEYVVHYIESGRAEGRKYAVPEDSFLRSLYPRDGGGAAAALAAGRRVYRDVADMLAANGIRSLDFMSAFDAADYITVSGEPSLADDLACLRHFCETGRALLLPISLECWFDPDFYAIHCPLAPRAPGEMYLHWLNEGHAAGFKPNASRFMKDLGLSQTDGFPPGVDTELYQGLNPDLTAALASKWDVLRHLVLYGILEQRSGAPAPAAAVDLYLAAADQLSVRNRHAEAKTLYETVLSVDPDNGFAAQHLGDCLNRLGDHTAAITRYRHVIAIGKANHWSYANLAECLGRTGRFAEATATLCQLRAAYPGDIAVASRVRAAAEHDFARARADADTLARAGLLAPARRVLARAAEALSAALGDRPPSPNRLAGDARAVLIVADMTLPQCRFYRVEQKEHQLRAAGIAVTTVNCWDPLDAIPGLLADIDVAIFYRVAALPAVMATIQAVREAGIPSFYDIDDLIFDAAHYPDSLASYGGQITRDEYAGLVTGTGLVRAAMAACDYGLASTRALAAMMEPVVLSGKAYVHRNALSPIHLRWSERAPAGKGGNEKAGGGVVRLFYGSGTKAHNEDFDVLVAPALRRLLDDGEVALEIVLMGYLTLPACLRPHAARIVMLSPDWDIAVYWGLLNRMDINIAVLKRTPMTDCKSEIKWLEAGMLGIPSVVSRTAAYEEVVADGVDGILAATAEDWYAALRGLIADPARRASIGAAARAKILDAYGIDAFSRNLVSIFRDISDRAAARPRPLVLVVNVFFPPQAIGGATRVVADNVAEITARHGADIDIEVFTTTEGGERPYDLRTYRWRGVKVTGVTAPRTAEVDLDPHDARMYAAFAAHVDARRPDIVHFHCIQRLTGAVCQVARDRGIPYYVSLHDGWWISDRQFLIDDFLRPRLYHAAGTAEILTSETIRTFGAKGLHRMEVLAGHLRAADALLAVSEPFAALYRDRGFTNVAVVANGVSDFEIHPRQPAASGRVRIGLLGGKSAHKGFNLLKAALLRGNFANLEVVVIDHALAPGTVVADMWGATPVRFRAKLPQHEIGRLYAEIDVLAAPSLWPESYGLVVREALLAGCWVIVSDRGALAGDVTPANGFVVDVADTAGLERVLRQIDRAPARYTRSPPPTAALRKSHEQADDLARLYLRRRGRAAPAGGATPSDGATPARAAPAAAPRPRGRRSDRSA